MKIKLRTNGPVRCSVGMLALCGLCVLYQMSRLLCSLSMCDCKATLMLHVG